MDDNLVYFDQLTHCHSRYYYDNVVKEKYNNKLCYVIYVDINNLKSINDKYGHCKGTELIKDTSKMLISIKGAKDICRIGGDEFIFFTDTDFDFSQINNIKNISYGIHLKKNNESIKHACNYADKNMYKMKKSIHTMHK